MATQEILIQVLKDKLRNDTLVLPTLPDVAIRIRKAVSDPETSLDTITDIILTDPALSARLIKMANSAYLKRSVSTKTVSHAVQRIGLHKIKSIATALAMEQLFVTRDAEIKQMMEQLWANTIRHMSSSLSIFKMYSTLYPSTELDQDTLMLACLVLNIGALPILKECEPYPDIFGTDFVQRCIAKLDTRIGCQILETWGFDSSIIKVVRLWKTSPNLAQTIGYTDIVKIGAAVCDMLVDSDTCLEQAFVRKLIPQKDLSDCEAYLGMKRNSEDMFN